MVKLPSCLVAAPVAGEQLVGADEALAGGNRAFRRALGYILGSTRAAVATADAAAATVDLRGSRPVLSCERWETQEVTLSVQKNTPGRPVSESRK
jgi:hypothetical protein